MRPIVQSKKLQHVRYDVRGPILVEAQRLESEGHKILKLNIGNTAPFGFEAPEAIVADMVHNLPEAQGYADSKGIYSARTAVAQYYQSRGLRETSVEDVYIGNGVSELISMVLQAFVDDGNEILVPAPDYPLWTGAVSLSGGTPVHYRCDEADGWNPDLADIEAKITPATQVCSVARRSARVGSSSAGSMLPWESVTRQPRPSSCSCASSGPRSTPRTRPGRMELGAPGHPGSLVELSRNPTNALEQL